MQQLRSNYFYNSKTNDSIVFNTSGLTGGTSYTIKVDGVVNPGSPGRGLIA